MFCPSRVHRPVAQPDMRIFLAIARSGSLGRAAKELRSIQNGQPSELQARQGVGLSLRQLALPATIPHAINATPAAHRNP